MRNSQDDTHKRDVGRRSRFALIALAGMLAVTALTATACSQGTPSATENGSSSSEGATEASTTEVPTAESVTKLDIKDSVVGTGQAVKAGDKVTVDYTGWLLDGTKFDSSLDSGQPFTFTVGGGQVIEGWDKGLVGMKVDGTRVLIIPASMAYGEQGSPPVIPANAPLKFEVKLLSVEPGQ
jgi:FKBP-type peptidyl-prolyl cis-trans isomerase